jgi:hypothetical protein
MHGQMNIEFSSLAIHWTLSDNASSEKHNGQNDLKFNNYLAIFRFLCMAICSLIARVDGNISDGPETASFR